MNEFFEKLIEKLIKSLLPAMKGALHALREWFELAWQWFERIGFALLEHLRIAISPEVVLAFLLAIVLTAVLIGVFLTVHLVINFVWRRRARVFISYQHDRESIANEL